MDAVLVVVLVVGLVFLTRYIARRQGFSNNQRIVLSGVAIGLLILNLISDFSIGKSVIVVIGIAVLMLGIVFLRKSS